ncbi:hypothetical protein FFJ24_010030 [Pedobacter sp. KBS0701]|uniref:hypothetical protein n=1 Tax=Pedobacter sp. KBS0701 TaxID=2578106 RepID=UPI00110E0AC3|nr:hypothetical protein [Pedobacter sp. KBS0701]QDW25130.1 hypothetical protein FFJ24_010030 [Pedobacter sp. KBS0701]
MITIKASMLLKEKLRETETEIISAIQKELSRIGRRVDSKELEHVPFDAELEQYIEGLRLDMHGTIWVDTSFEDITEKRLIDFLSDGEVRLEFLLDLLILLEKIC